MPPTLSVIVPVYNEEDALPTTYETLNTYLNSLNVTFEVLVIDNGSRDKTEAIMQDITSRDKVWRYVRLSRDFSYQNSLTAAMSMARGEAIVTIDADLQDPPEMIEQFIDYWKQGYDIVYGFRNKRAGESRIRMFLTEIMLRVITFLSDYPVPKYSSDFRLISSRVRDALLQMPESNRYLRGLVHWVGFKQIGIPYQRRPRSLGADTRGTSAGPVLLVNLTLDAIFSFSRKPLRLFFFIGIFTMFLAIALIIGYVVLSLFSNPPRGIMTLLVFALIQLGFTAFGFGIVGEYIGRIYEESKRRPLWIIDYTLNFEEPEDE